MPHSTYALATSWTEGTTSATWTAWNRTLELTTTITSGTASGGGAAGSIVIYGDEDCTTTSLTSAKIWSGWNRKAFGGTGSTATLTMADPWITWNRQLNGQLSATIARANIPPPVTISDEEYQAQRRQAAADRERRQAEWAAEQVIVAKAKERAQVILDESLSAKQREELAAKSYFTVSTVRPNGERRYYQIHRGRSRNIKKVDANGKYLGTICAHPAEFVPDEDTMLTQLLMLKGGVESEDELLRIANHS